MNKELIMLIDIEGTDGSGKAVQTKKLYDYLVEKGYKCKLISFPNYDSPSSEPVKMYLSGEIKDDFDGHQNSVLYAVDRLITMHNDINIEDYDFVLFDRYVPSNMIHQSTKMNNQVDIDRFIDWIVDFEYSKLKLPIPDKIIFLDNPPEFSIPLARSRMELKNKKQKDILESDDNHIRLAYARAKYIANKFDWIHINCVDKKLKTIEQIHKEILTKLGL